MDGLIPKMQELAASTGSEEAINRVARPQGGSRGLKTEADDVATRINGDVGERLPRCSSRSDGREIRQGRVWPILLDLGDFSAINRIAAQKIAEELFGGMTKGGGGGLGPDLRALPVGRFRIRGGYVTGQAPTTSDSIPARLSAGNMSCGGGRAPVGVEFLHALNGGLAAPRWLGPRLVSPTVAWCRMSPAPRRSSLAIGTYRQCHRSGMAADYLNSAAGENHSQRAFRATVRPCANY